MVKLGLLRKVSRSLQTVGLQETFIRIVRYPFIPFTQRRLEERIFRHRSIEDRFTEIYKLNYWSSRESVSGAGSKLANTENLRKNLPLLIEKFGIRSIFDAPCGDFNWMKHVVSRSGLEYTGGDIVAPLIESLIHNYGDEKTKFVHLDITKDKFPRADIMICRDSLFHLSFADTVLALKIFVQSEIPFLLTSTHLNTSKFENKDIITGAFRFIDLFSAPYNFPRDVYYRISDALEEGKETEVCLWGRDQIAAALESFAENKFQKTIM